MNASFNDQLKTNIEKIVKDLGAAAFGVSDLQDYRDFIQQFSGDSFSGLNRGISVAVPFPSMVIEQLLEGPTLTYLYYYNVINILLDQIGLKVSNYLQLQGFKAFPIPSSQRVSKDKMHGIFPHRLSAYLAGIGWIGKSNLIISPKLGPRIRVVTILTDAPLKPDMPISNGCKNCRICIDACPGKAIKETTVTEPAEYSERISPQLCHDYKDEVRGRWGKRICGLCLAVCPVGKEGYKSNV